MGNVGDLRGERSTHTAVGACAAVDESVVDPHRRGCIQLDLEASAPVNYYTAFGDDHSVLAST